MKRIRAFGIFVLLLAALLSGCSVESLVEKSSGLLDQMLRGDPDTPRMSVASGPSSPSKPVLEPAAQDPEDTQSHVAVEPSIPDAVPVTAEQSQTSPDTSPASSANITPSHTDATFFGPGESFKYLPKGVEGVYACTYATADESVATVDQDTGKVTAVGPGTTKVTMHLEYNGQYDFECIIRCNWKDEDKEPALPAGGGAPATAAKPAGSSAPDTSAISASHSDATFFNPKEHFRFLPVGAGEGCTCSYTTGDADVATVDSDGTVTAVGPGTTTVTMTVDGGGTEYIFKCIVRCNWS